MTQHITIRPIELDDYTGIAQLIKETWYLNDYKKSPKTIDAYINFDINDCLNRSSFGQVAVKNDTIVGVILARVNHHKPYLRQFNRPLMTDLLTLLEGNSSDQRSIARDEKERLEANNTMLKSLSKNYDGEIVLFIVSSSEQGNGIGSNLLTKLSNHFDTHQVNNYFLFTDIWCNINFYEHKGFKRIASFPFENENPQYFIYSNSIDSSLISE